MQEAIFKNIEQALKYHEYCPICSKRLMLNSNSNIDYVSYLNDKITITNFDANITIGVKDNSFSFEEISRYSDHYEIGSPTRSFIRTRSTPLPNSGQFMIGLNMECQNSKCTQYSYTFVIHLDLGNKSFKYATLNSEWISVEDGPDVFEICNIYSTGITKYTHHLSDGNSKKCEIPLIPINIADPKETLARLKNLIIFT